ncbi:hypothetical protein OTU49_008817 [Cherax quadricarinatus]|uniref:Uncharacterized protein n=1 Tax=Cherax quadricarinatus TaxID=27406 RepID=A0AAW0WUE7_CHEQU
MPVSDQLACIQQFHHPPSHIQRKYKAFISGQARLPCSPVFGSQLNSLIWQLFSSNSDMASQTRPSSPFSSLLKKFLSSYERHPYLLTCVKMTRHLYKYFSLSPTILTYGQSCLGIFQSQGIIGTLS